MGRYKIVVEVSFDDETEPSAMADHLDDNVARCVQTHGLLNDPEREAVIDEWTVEVTDCS